MKVGDKVQVLGTVRDIVDKNVLVLTDDSPGAVGKEYWFRAEDVQEQPAPTEATAAEATSAPAETGTPEAEGKPTEEKHKGKAGRG